MKYTKDERLDIGRRIYDGEISRYDAAEEYGINYTTARDYMRLYRDANNLPPKKQHGRKPSGKNNHAALKPAQEPTGLEDYEAMSKEELIHELVLARIKEARLKKGYEVKGDGTVILYGSKNTK